MCKIVNPWTGISWEKTIADCDKKYFDDKYGSPKKYVEKVNNKDIKDGKEVDNPIKLTFTDCLPEPFSGDINSEVYCLCMNPGDPDPNFCSAYDEKNYVYQKQANLILEQSLGPHQLLIPPVGGIRHNKKTD